MAGSSAAPCSVVAVIVDVEARRAIRQAEVGAARTMIERTQDRFGLWPERLAADSAYGSAENLAWLVHDRGIEPHIPVFDKSERKDGTFERVDFTYDHKRDLYTCPGGKELRQRQKAYRMPRPLVDENGLTPSEPSTDSRTTTGTLLDAFTPQECTNYFKAAGYGPD